MRLGITAFLTDRDMTPGDLARAAEERGFDSFYLPEHTHLPLRADTPPALVEGVRLDDYKRSLDPFVALASAVAVTEGISSAPAWSWSPSTTRSCWASRLPPWTI